MNVHLFGAVSSPNCSNFALRKAADDSADGAEAADVLQKNFYIDDCLRSEEKEDTAIQRKRDVRHACALGGFNLATFISNSKTILESILEEAHAAGGKSLELGSDYYPVERALGHQGVEATHCNPTTVGNRIGYVQFQNRHQRQTTNKKGNTVNHIFNLRPPGV